ELERRHRGEVSEQHERLVKRRRHVIRAAPAAVDVRVGADHVVVREQVSEAELLHAFAVGAYGTDIAGELGLWEDNSDSHVLKLGRDSAEEVGELWEPELEDAGHANASVRTLRVHEELGIVPGQLPAPGQG